MSENNEYNLVISDEDSVNPRSNRSHPNTLNQNTSPGAQFARRRAAGGSFPPNGVVSSPQNEFFPNHEQEFNNGQHGGSHSHVQYQKVVTSSQDNVYFMHSENKKNTQFTKKAKRQQEEADSLEEHVLQRGGEEENHQIVYEGEPDNRIYVNSETPHADMQPRMIKTTSDGFVEDHGDEPNTFLEDEDPRSQSLRDSQLSGPLRYSKMSEEEAARAFENRKKELFNTYLKKGPQKSPGLKKSPQANRNQKGKAREFQSPEDINQGQNTVNNFIIYNNKEDQGQNKLSSAQYRAAGNKKLAQGPNNNRRSSFDKKKSPTNTVTLAKQRRESPKNAEKVNSQKPTPQNKRPLEQTENSYNNKKEGQEIRQNQQNKPRDSQRSSAGREEEVDQYVPYAQGKSDDQNQPYLNPYYVSAQIETVDSQEQNNVYFINKVKRMNQDIINDIHNLDEEILRLEIETNQTSNTKGNEKSYQQNYSSRSENVKKKNYDESRISSQRDASLDRKNQGKSKEKEYPVNENVLQEREKRGRINELNAEKGAQTGGNSHGYIKDQIYQSYMVLNEKGFDHHYDYLYERALIQKKSRSFLNDRSREMREKQEMSECTFSPNITPWPFAKNPDIVTKTKNWQLEQERKLQMNERNKIEKELRECTFYPNNLLGKGTKLEFNANDFYKRNIEWLKRKEANDLRKQTEFHNSIMTAPERSRSHTSFNMSRLQDSQVLSDKNKFGSPDRADDKKRLARSNSNKSLRGSQRIERSRSTKNREESENKNRNSYKKAKQSNLSKDRDQMSQKIQTPVESRESVNNNPKDLKLDVKTDIVESYAILNNLEQMFSAKERAYQEKIRQQKQNVEKKLKTISMLADGNKKQGTIKILNKSRVGVSPTRSQPRLSGKIPATSLETNASLLDENNQKIVVRNNRYYIEEMPDQIHPYSRVSRERSNSTQKRGLTPRQQYSTNRWEKEGSYAAAASQAKMRRESPFKASQTNKYDTARSRKTHSEFIGSPARSALGSSQSYGLFRSTQSPPQDLNYVAKGVTSPNTQVLEKKYTELVSQIGRVTKQLTQISVENNTLQQDIHFLQKNRANTGTLFS